MSFENWFGNSVVKDNQGKPLIVYHGSKEKFDTFNPEKTIWGDVSKGFCFFTNKKSGYCNSARDYAGSKGVIYECYLKIEKPLHITYENHYPVYYYTPIEYFDMHHNTIRKQFIEGNYDGIIIENKNHDTDDSVLYAVPKANQIKSINAKEFSDSDNMNEQITYHGTSRQFDKFDLDKVKEYNYGFGIYFSWDKNHAGGYGNVSEYEIPDEKYMLDWDWGYRFQNDYIKECLDKIYDDLESKDNDWLLEKFYFDGIGNGEYFYGTVGEILHCNSRNVSKFLYKYGIKGIVTESGNCYVVFNPDDITRKNIIKQTNEMLEQLMEQTPMYRSNQPTFEDFYNYVIKNPKCKKCYYDIIYPYKLRIPSDTVLHDYKKHGTSLEDWKDCLDSIENIVFADVSKKKLYSNKADIFLAHICGKKDYGITLQDNKQITTITTLFADHPNTIDNWIKTDGAKVLTSQLSASDTSKSSSVTIFGHPSNNIISYLKEKIKR